MSGVLLGAGENAVNKTNIAFHGARSSEGDKLIIVYIVYLLKCSREKEIKEKVQRVVGEGGGQVKLSEKLIFE